MNFGIKDSPSKKKVFLCCFFLRAGRGYSLAVQGLGLHAFTAKGPGSIPGQGTKTPPSHMAQPKIKKFKK